MLILTVNVESYVVLILGNVFLCRFLFSFAGIVAKYVVSTDIYVYIYTIVKVVEYVYHKQKKFKSPAGSVPCQQNNLTCQLFNFNCAR